MIKYGLWRFSDNQFGIQTNVDATLENFYKRDSAWFPRGTYTNSQPFYNTTITVSGQPSTHYAVHSDRYATTTRVTRVVKGSDPVSVGAVRRRSVLADRLTVGGVDFKLNQWLKMPLLQNL